MIKKIEKWLANPKRNYHEGKEYFNKYASDSAKAQFSKYFNEVKPSESPEQFDNHFTILINQLRFVVLRLKRNPKAFVAAANADEKSKQKGADKDKGEDKGENDTENNAENNSENKLEVVRFETLPKQFDKDKTRLKELVPLMASIHADMASGEITDEERKSLANELVQLDLERRSIWDRIENYLSSEGKELEPEDMENDYSENDVVRGAQMAARIERLKENITNNQNSILRHKEKGKEHLIPNAEKRVAKYQKELTELEAQLNEK